MKAYFRYQKGYLYEEHGAWYVRYRQRVPQKDGSSKLKHISKHLGRSQDFSNIFAVERCRASFMQTVNQDRLSTNPRITLTTFVEGLYLPWTKEERRASTSTGHRQIWINHLRDRVGELRLREFRTVDASRMLRAVAKANVKDQPFDVEIGGQPSEDTRQPRFRADNSCLGGNPGRIPKIHG